MSELVELGLFVGLTLVAAGWLVVVIAGGVALGLWLHGTGGTRKARFKRVCSQGHELPPAFAGLYCPSCEAPLTFESA